MFWVGWHQIICIKLLGVVGHCNLHICIWLNSVSFINSACHTSLLFFLLVLAKFGGYFVSDCCDHLSYIHFCVQFLSLSVKYPVQLPSGSQAWKSVIHSQAFYSGGNNINIWYVLGSVLDLPVAYTTFGRRTVSCNRFCINLICLLHCAGIFGTACAHKWYLQFVLLISNLITSPLLGPTWIIIPTYISPMETLKCKRAKLYKRSSSRRWQSS
jgi:hypothetical protein